ncbi:hypothetical protein [Melioribacter sp. OK-6-Me]|uniref:hypothetical protein n=1 Tax=unclassified Melioribacter TaxID=2627329 RepID=UPI003EDB019D
MLINLSNHPFERWSENQKKIAESNFGKVIDIPFPEIPPESSLEYVTKLAEEYMTKIEDLINQNRPDYYAVHIMGELTFVYVIVNKLKEKNIPAVASTTKREVVDTPEGKLSKFNFTRFRNYF